MHRDAGGVENIAEEKESKMESFVAINHKFQDQKTISESFT